EAAAGDLADRRAAGIDNRRAIARRGAAVRTDAGPLARGSFRELPQLRCGTGETAFGAPPFADRPGEPGFDRCRGFIDIMTVEAQPGLEAPRLASAGPERRYLRLGQQPLGDTHRLIGGQRNLEPVFAGVARAGHRARR